MRQSRRTTLRTLALAGSLPMFARSADVLAQESGPIRIGLLVPLTGAAAAYGPEMAKAGRLAAERINKEAGGLLGGRPLEVLVEDTESSATAGVAAARKLLDVEKVSILTGVWNSSVAMALKPIVLERQMGMLVSGSADAITEGDTKGLIWRFQAKGKDWGGVIGRAMLKSDLKRVCILGLQNPFTVGMIEPFSEAIRKGGGEVVEKVFYNPGQPSYRSEVEQIFSKNTDGVFMPALLPDFTAIAKEVFRSGFTSRIFTLSIAADSEGKFVQNVGAKVAEGITHLQPTPPAGSTAYRKFARMMNETDDRVFLFACNTYDQFAMLAMAIEKSKSTSAPELLKHFPAIAHGPGDEVDDPVDGLRLIRAGKPLNYTGAGSSVEFSASGDLVNREFTQYQIRNGRNQVISIVS
ncbi:MAG: ABC transporter substrate-binding protein [Lautropia sp.]|nr:ABC transporter substrate-binding protein [Lautropia sp.]